jgi:hypothetical protein
LYIQFASKNVFKDYFFNTLWEQHKWLVGHQPNFSVIQQPMWPTNDQIWLKLATNRFYKLQLQKNTWKIWILISRSIHLFLNPIDKHSKFKCNCWPISMGIELHLLVVTTWCFLIRCSFSTKENHPTINDLSLKTMLDLEI